MRNARRLFLEKRVVGSVLGEGLRLMHEALDPQDGGKPIHFSRGSSIHLAGDHQKPGLKTDLVLEKNDA